MAPNMIDTEMQIRKTISETLNVHINDVKDDLAVGDLPEWDSLGHVRIIMALEAHFSCELEAAELLQLDTVSDLVKAFSR